LRRQLLAKLARTRDRVLEGSGLREGATLLDVGCGEGLIGFGALERGAGHVVFSDISEDLLAFCREAADALGLTGRCSFVQAAADDLGEIGDSSVDVVTTRSVLIYVAEKQRAFAEFFRILRPGGRAAIWEPINRFGSEERTTDAFWGYPADGLSELAERIESVFREIQPPDDPMLDFDERDLIRFAEQAGFFPVELSLDAEVRPRDPQSWNAFLHSSGNPRIPTFAEAMDEALSPEERERVTEQLRPLVEQGRGVWRMAHAYLVATKPSA
jgi:SAM-dependent methyltransferase